MWEVARAITATAESGHWIYGARRALAGATPPVDPSCRRRSWQPSGPTRAARCARAAPVAGALGHGGAWTALALGHPPPASGPRPVASQRGPQPTRGIPLFWHPSPKITALGDSLWAPAALRPRPCPTSSLGNRTRPLPRRLDGVSYAFAYDLRRLRLRRFHARAHASRARPASRFALAWRAAQGTVASASTRRSASDIAHTRVIGCGDDSLVCPPFETVGTARAPEHPRVVFSAKPMDLTTCGRRGFLAPHQREIKFKERFAELRTALISHWGVNVCQRTSWSKRTKSP